MPWQMVTFCKPPSDHRTSKLYFLKKIHKNLRGIRPIVSSVNSITENISKFVDYWLQPIVKQLPFYIKDTTTFANFITQTPVPPDCKLVSIDASSLYVTGFDKTLRMGFFHKIAISTQIVSMTFELIAQQVWKRSHAWFWSYENFYALALDSLKSRYHALNALLCRSHSISVYYSHTRALHIT